MKVEKDKKKDLSKNRVEEKTPLPTREKPAPPEYFCSPLP